MDAKEKARMEEFGYVATTASEWLGLTQAESHEIEIGIALTFFLGSVRERSGLSVARAARKLKTTPARLSRLERGEPGTSLDLLITSALGLGATFRDVGEAIASWPGEPGVEEDAGADQRGMRPSAEPQAKSGAPAARPVRRTRSAKAA